MNYSKLREMEKKVVIAAGQGASANFKSGNHQADNPENGASWGEDRTIRAQIIRDLCLGTNPRWTVHTKGLQIKGAKITGKLDLEAAAISHPLLLIDCYFENQMTFTDAETRMLDLSGSHTKDIWADGITAHSHVILDGIKVEGELRLIGADIGGNLSCKGANLNNPSGKALNADRVKTKGCVYLNNSFFANGWVRLVGANLGGDLYCAGRFQAPEEGVNRRREVLSADHLTTKAGVFLYNGFVADGEVRLLNMRVAGDLRCEKAIFKNPGKKAFTAENMKVTGTFRWRNLCEQPKDEVSFAYANVGQLDDDPGSWPKEGKLVLDGFVYQTFHENAETNAKTRKKWMGLQPAYRPQPYEQLVQVLRRMGHEGDARKIAIVKQDAWMKELRKQKRWAAWFWKLLLWSTIGYGYRLWLIPLFWFPFFITIGTGVFNCADRVSAIKPAKREVLADQKYVKSGPPQENYPIFDSLLYSVDLLIPIISLNQKSNWLATHAKEYCSFPIYGATWEIYVSGRFYQLYTGTHQVFGWILTSLLVAGLTGLVKKD